MAPHENVIILLYSIPIELGPFNIFRIRYALNTIGFIKCQRVLYVRMYYKLEHSSRLGRKILIFDVVLTDFAQECFHGTCFF